MASWDVFHAESLELERGLSSDAVRAALAGGSLGDDDLIRPAGSTVAWARLGDFSELAAPGESSTPGEAGPPQGPTAAPPRETISRVEPKEQTVVEHPERIRAGRVEVTPTRPAPSDFELRAEDLESAPGAASSTPHPPAPAWIELGGESDDVTFPVIPDEPHDETVHPAASRFQEVGPDSGGSHPPAFRWPSDDDEGEEESSRYDDGEEPVVEGCEDQIEILDDEVGLEILDGEGLGVATPFSREATSGNGASRVSLPVVPSRDWNEDNPPVEGGEEEEDFTLSRSGPMTVEELDLAPMVDVAFQLVLFFMVTATTVLYKTLEIPKPTTDQAQSAVAQGHSRSVEDLQKDYVLVEIDPGGTIKIDREPVSADVDAMAERLRIAREKTGRKIMLLSADYATPHRNAVLAYDAAIEIGMGIAIARPNAPQGPAPRPFDAPGKEEGMRGISSPPAAPAAPLPASSSKKPF